MARCAVPMRRKSRQMAKPAGTTPGRKAIRHPKQSADDKRRARAVVDVITPGQPNKSKSRLAGDVAILAEDSTEKVLAALGLRSEILPTTDYSPEFTKKVKALAPVQRSLYELNRSRVLSEINRFVTPVFIAKVLSDTLVRFVSPSKLAEAREYVRERVSIGSRTTTD